MWKIWTKKPTMFSVWKNHWKKTTLGISQNVNNFVPKEQSVSKQDQQKMSTQYCHYFPSWSTHCHNHVTLYASWTSVIMISLITTIWLQKKRVMVKAIMIVVMILVTYAWFTSCFFLSLLDLRGCKNGQPIITSKPHFFQGDSSLLE